MQSRQPPKLLDLTHVFYAWESDMSGELGGSSELADLAFLDIEKALELPLVDVTQFMLEEIIRRGKRFTIPATYPFSISQRPAVSTL